MFTWGKFGWLAGVVVCALFLTAAAIMGPMEAPAQQSRTVQDICLGQWEWDTATLDNPFWRGRHLESLLGSIDLRSIPAMSRAGGIPEGYGIFAYNTAISDGGMRCFGADLNRTLLPVERTVTEFLLGLPGGSLRATTPEALIWELLTEHGDPTGQTRWSGIKPTRDGRLIVHLGGGTVLERVATRAQMQGARAGAMLYPAPAPLLITVNEDFDCADADELDCDLPWTEFIGSGAGDAFDIISSTAENVGNGTVQGARADSDLDSDDHYVQADVSSFVGSSFIGVITRFSASAHTGYIGRYRDSDTLSYRIEKISAGTISNLATVNESPAPGNGPLDMRFETDGSDLELFIGGVSKLTATDSSITGNLRGGIHSEAGINRTRVDNWEAADLAAPEPTPTPQPGQPSFYWSYAAEAVPGGG